MAKRKVGIVGLGIMGGAFARNLVAASWNVVGYDIDETRRRALARAGVKIAGDVKALAAEAETIITSLPKPAALDATVNGIIAAGVGPRVVFELRAPMMVRDRYDDASMKISIWQKDMAVIGEFARALGCPTPMFDATVPVYDKAMRSGHAEHDTAAVCAVLEKMAGMRRDEVGPPRQESRRVGKAEPAHASSRRKEVRLRKARAHLGSA